MSRDKQNLFYLLALSLLAGCGKDKTLDQYQQEQAAAACTQLQNAAGTSRGTLVTQGTGQPLGGLETALDVTQVPAGNGSNTGSIGKCVLTGSVKIVSGSAQASAAVTGASYVPSADDQAVGNLTLTLSVALSGASTATFNLTGHLDHGRLSGEISPSGFVGSKGSFVLNRDAPMPHVGQGSTLPGGDGSLYYAGTYVKKRCLDPQFKDSIYCKNVDPSRASVKMAINANQSSGLTFVNFFAEPKLFPVQLTFGRVVFTLPSAEYKPSAGTLSFQGAALGDTTQSTLACQAEGSGWSCSFRNENAADTYTFHLTRQANPPGNGT